MLLDTSGLFSLLDRRDPQHVDATTLLEAAPVCVTHGYVLAELIPLSLSRGVSRQTTIAYCRQLLTARNVIVIWGDGDLHAAALNLLERRLDKTYSLCDAVSFVLMEQGGMIEALTTDHHFEQEGFRRLLG
jgi:predicted nucleic acid-binding protein